MKVIKCDICKKEPAIIVYLFMGMESDPCGGSSVEDNNMVDLCLNCCAALLHKMSKKLKIEDRIDIWSEIARRIVK